MFTAGTGLSSRGLEIDSEFVSLSSLFGSVSALRSAGRDWTPVPNALADESLDLKLAGTTAVDVGLIEPWLLPDAERTKMSSDNLVVLPEFDVSVLLFIGCRLELTLPETPPVIDGDCGSRVRHFALDRLSLGASGIQFL